MKNKLSVKIFFILLPLAISILLFSYGYYQAREKLTIDHVFQSGQLSASIGSSEISHYIEGRFAEFDRLSGAMSTCEVSTDTLPKLSSNAINFTRGFSALIISDLSGRAVNFNLSANKSNRYILRQDIEQLQVLTPLVLERLESSYQQWLTSYPKNLSLEEQALNKLLDLKQRGEENSQASRDISNQLVKLREQRNYPKLVLSFATTDIVSQLGLIFNDETYFFTRPLVDCEQNLIGYYTAVLDRTLIKDHIANIKQSLVDSGLERIDVFLVRNHDTQPLCGVNYLSVDKFQQYGLNDTTEPRIRNELDGIMITHPIDLELKQYLIFESLSAQGVSEPEFDLSLAVFISNSELEQSHIDHIKEVSLYLLIALALFAVLTIYLSHYIASPIIDLRKRILVLSRQGEIRANFDLREDEIGDLFKAFSDMAHNIKYKESQLTKLATEDPLTGILNRRALVDKALDHHRVYAPSCICMMDLDHFKQVNDKCGHSIGDKVLVAFCEIVASEIRHSDLLGRLGGEEFALVLPQTNLDDGIQLAERIRQRVEAELAASVCGSFDIAITVSIGVVEWHAEDFNKALSRADKCLYEAKALGRNQTCS